MTETTTIDPTARYAVIMKMPVRVGLAVYRPDQTHEMVGSMVLAVAAAAGAGAGAGEATIDSVLAATPIG